MSQISAADNLIIEMGTHRWRLIANDDARARVIAEAVEGGPLRYKADFGSSRRLPSDGALPAEEIQRVVLGWSARDDAWHLGLVLGSRLASSRGSRWCELAHWPDIEGNLFLDIASQAGDVLSQILRRPFNVVPRRVEPEAPPPPPTPLPALPLSIGIWTLSWANDSQKLWLVSSEETPARALEFIRSRGWALSRTFRILWYTLWVAIYLILSIATLTRTLALPNSGTMLPNPEFLPYMGLIAAVVLAGMILYMIFELLARPDRIVVEPQQRTITALRGRRERWRVNADSVQSVYVTQVVSKKPGKHAVFHGELNLHLGGGQFYRVLEQGTAEEDRRSGSANSFDGREAVVPLAPDAIRTDLQAAGLYLARALGGLPCWYDQRAK